MNSNHFWTEKHYTNLIVSILGGALLIALTVGAVLWMRGPVEEPIARGLTVGSVKVPYYACILFNQLGKNAVGVVVSLSDTTRYPHSYTDTIVLKSLAWVGDMSANQHWHVHIGVITGTNSVTGSLLGVQHVTRNRQANFAGDLTFPEHGLNLRVTKGYPGAASYMVSSEPTDDHYQSWWFSNSFAITSSVQGYNEYIGIGDLVIYLEEITDGALFDFQVCAGYDTE